MLLCWHGRRAATLWKLLKIQKRAKNKMFGLNPKHPVCNHVFWLVNIWSPLAQSLILSMRLKSAASPSGDPPTRATRRKRRLLVGTALGAEMTSHGVNRMTDRWKMQTGNMESKTEVWPTLTKPGMLLGMHACLFSRAPLRNRRCSILNRRWAWLYPSLMRNLMNQLSA